MITGNEGLDFSLEFASSLLWQVNVVSLNALCSHAIFFSAEEEGITSTCILRSLALCLGFILLLLLLSGSRGIGDIFLPVFVFVFVPLQVLQFFSYLNFEFGVKLMSDLCLEYCVLSKLREVSSALDRQVGDGGRGFIPQAAGGRRTWV